MKKEQLLAEIEDLLRALPPSAMASNETSESQAWYGRAMAILNQWDRVQSILADAHLQSLQNRDRRNAPGAYNGFMTLLHRARHDLMMQTVGPLSTVVDSGKVFDYFDEIRKIIELATTEVFFVDPYLDADFVARYLPHIPLAVPVRLLAAKKLPTLVPAVQAFVQQTNMKIELRSAQQFHDRYVFVDRASCYHSGASFKDGGRNAPTTITQITDAFPVVFQTYEDIWRSGQSHI